MGTEALTSTQACKEETKIDRVLRSVCVLEDFCKSGTSQMGRGLKRAFLVCLVLKGIFKGNTD